MTLKAHRLKNGKQYQLHVTNNNIPIGYVIFHDASSPLSGTQNQAVIDSVRVFDAKLRMNPLYPLYVQLIAFLKDEGFRDIQGTLPEFSDIILSVVGIRKQKNNKIHKRKQGVFIHLNITSSYEMLHSSAIYLLDIPVAYEE